VTKELNENQVLI